MSMLLVSSMMMKIKPPDIIFYKLWKKAQSSKEKKKRGLLGFDSGFCSRAAAAAGSFCDWLRGLTNTLNTRVSCLLPSLMEVLRDTGVSP